MFALLSDINRTVHLPTYNKLIGEASLLEQNLMQG
jgi:hypothetical protein